MCDIRTYVQLFNKNHKAFIAVQFADNRTRVWFPHLLDCNILIGNTQLKSVLMVPTLNYMDSQRYGTRRPCTLTKEHEHRAGLRYQCSLDMLRPAVHYLLKLLTSYPSRWQIFENGGSPLPSWTMPTSRKIKRALQAEHPLAILFTTWS